jgi:glycosyltransferase involved in cell wall biosynthesis
MRLVLSTIGKFHTFDLARELQARGVLKAIFSGFPEFKLRNEQLPRASVHTFPWVHAPYMGLRYRGLLRHRFNRLWKYWEYLDKITFDRFVSSRMPACDVFVGLSGSALNSGKVAQRCGARYVCDRGSSHIRVQDQLIHEEYARWDLRFEGVDQRVIDLEEAEYATSDCITIPSAFCLRSFVSQGIPETKLRLIPYGVNLERFYPTGTPDTGRFDVLFVGSMHLRKGVQYLLQAYARVRHPRKSLTFAGGADRNLIDLMKKRSLWPENVQVLGHIPQPRLKEIMSRSHTMVLPSIEEGLAMVLAQAMACGCPVIGSEHTGAEDLFTDGREGFIVPIRRADEIAERLQRLADDPALRSRMSAAAVARVKQLGGWHAYGERAFAVYESLLA